MKIKLDENLGRRGGVSADPRDLRAEGLTAAIADVREKLRRGAYSNEDQVSKQVVIRLLQALRWAVHDPQRVTPEFSIGTRRVDYALIPDHRGPVVLIEVKRVGRAKSTGEDQLLSYCFQQGVPLAVLTDGRSWKFYLPGGRGSYEQRRFGVLDLLDDEASQCVETLQRYLAFDAAASGQSFQDARRDQQKRFEERVERPSLREHARQSPDRPGTRPASSPPSFTFRREQKTFTTNREVIGAVFLEFAQQYPGFCERCAPGDRRLASRKQDLSDLHQRSARQLPGGWWLSTGGSVKDHERRLRRACRIVGIRYGTDLTVNLVPRNRH